MKGEPIRAATSLSELRLDRRSPTPLYRQLVDVLRDDILAGAVRPGQRLAATRTLALDLGISRNTVLAAIDQLTAEGYLRGRVGAGTFVVETLPDDLLRRAPERGEPTATEGPGLSRRGERFRAVRDSFPVRPGRPFQLGRPALDLFPWDVWSRIAARRARELPRGALHYSDPAGSPRLRESLALHLRSARGLECHADQILVVRGSQQGLDLVTRVLLDEGDAVAMEDPGYPAARAAFAASGARAIPVAVDADGLDPASVVSIRPPVRLVYTTPSHQYPLGATLSLSRRLELLAWAREVGAWILEDDYDGEFRFAGRPLASLAGLDRVRHVVYLGTLSKVLFPGLRLGFLVVPREHVDAFVGARIATDRCSGVLEQEVLADFFEAGHFDRHVRRMRKVYADRQTALVEACSELLADHLELCPTPAGLHDVAWLRPPRSDAEIAVRAGTAGVEVGALSHYALGPVTRPALLFGYAGFPVSELREAVRRLRQVLESVESVESG